MTKGFFWDHGGFSGGLISLTTSSGIPASLVRVLAHLENGGVTWVSVVAKMIIILK